MSPKDADGIANSVDPDQTAPRFCPGLSVKKLARISEILEIHKSTFATNHSFYLQPCSYMKFEPPHDKTNKMSVRPAKTQICLGIHPVWSESSLCT